jgi:acyl carrier protein
MNREAIESAIRDFLSRDLFGARLARALEVGDLLFELGLIDSMAVVKTVAFCEQTFDVRVPDEELLPENFETIGSIAAMVTRLRAGSA